MHRFFKHDCFPNACRFDHVNVNPPHHAAASPNNTDIIIRMTHDVRQGMEICLSYFVVNKTYSSRQKKILLEDYCFKCNCESNCSDDARVEENVEEDEQEVMVG